MSIPLQDVKVGQFLVKGQYVREIVRDYGNRVQYRTYLLKTGQPQPVLEACTKQHLLHWAERECTVEEFARMNVREARMLERQTNSFYIRKLLDVIPNDELVQEVRRRGLSLDDR